MLEKGNVVTICLPESSFNGIQGEVAGRVADTNEVLVKLSPNDEYLLGYCATEEEKQIRFPESALKKNDCWSPENLAVILWGKHMFHSLQVLKAKFVPGGKCRHKDCQKPIAKRIMVNIWGTAIQYDVCEEHAQQYHGKCLDDFPSEEV